MLTSLAYPFSLFFKPPYWSILRFAGSSFHIPMIQLHTSLSLCLHLVLRQNPILDKPCFLLSPGPHVGSQVLPEKKTRQSTPGVLLTQDTYSAVLPVNQHSRSNHSLILLNDHFKSYVLSRTSLVLQWLKLCISNAGGHGFDAWSENWDPVCLAEWSKEKKKLGSFPSNSLSADEFCSYFNE